MFHALKSAGKFRLSHCVIVLYSLNAQQMPITQKCWTKRITHKASAWTVLFIYCETHYFSLHTRAYTQYHSEVNHRHNYPVCIVNTSITRYCQSLSAQFRTHFTMATQTHSITVHDQIETTISQMIFEHLANRVLIKQSLLLCSANTDCVVWMGPTMGMI